MYNSLQDHPRHRQSFLISTSQSGLTWQSPLFLVDRSSYGILRRFHTSVDSSDIDISIDRGIIYCRTFSLDCIQANSTCRVGSLALIFTMVMGRSSPDRRPRMTISPR